MRKIKTMVSQLKTSMSNHIWYKIEKCKIKIATSESVRFM